MFNFTRVKPKIVVLISFYDKRISHLKRLGLPEKSIIQKEKLRCENHYNIWYFIMIINIQTHHHTMLVKCLKTAAVNVNVVND